MIPFLFTTPFIGPAFKAVAALPAWALAALLTAGAAGLFYEGISIPFTNWNIIEGRVDKVRNQQRAICEAEKARSQKQAREDDQANQRERIEDMAEQVRRSQERALAAQEALRQDAELDAMDDAADVAAGRPAFNCKLGTRGLQPRRLPYPIEGRAGN